MLAAFRNAIYSPKVDKSAPARHDTAFDRMIDCSRFQRGQSFRKGQRDDRPRIKKAALAGGPPSTIYSCRIRLQIARRQWDPVIRQYRLQRRDARVVISGIALGDRLRRRTRCVCPGKRTPLPGKRGTIILVAHERPPPRDYRDVNTAVKPLGDLVGG